METRQTVCEIVEVGEGIDARSRRMLKQKQVYSVEDDIDKLFQAIDIRPVREESLWKNRMKRPMRASTSHASGIGISGSSNLKQALRGLCILQASEMAAMKRQSLKLSGLPGASDVGNAKWLYRAAVVAEANEPAPSLNKDKGNSLRNSLHHDHCAEVSRTRLSNQSQNSSTSSVPAMVSKSRMLRAASQDKVMPLPQEACKELLNAESEQKGKQKAKVNSQAVHALGKELTGVSSNSDSLKKLSQQDKTKTCEDTSLQFKDELHPEPCTSSSSVSDPKKSPRSSPHLRKLALQGKRFVMGKEKGNKAPIKTSSANTIENASTGISSDMMDSAASQASSSKAEAFHNAAKSDMRLQSKEKGEISQSSKSSRGDFSSSTTSISEESSSLSGSSRCGNRPHMSKDLRWDAIRQMVAHHGSLSLKHFKLHRRLGSGDIGSVYLAQLLNTDCLFALKVMDNEFLARRKKLSRAETEREILQMLDHPFLPTLYAHFSTDRLSCLVMEYCPGGDLHVVRQKQPTRIFSEQAARFYAAEVLLAIEYLHMLGVVYRDLKPENILVREDGHIMLSDFDLSLRCAVNPTILRSTSPSADPQRKTNPCTESSCIDPFCLQPTWEASCFTPRLLLTSSSKTRKLKLEDGSPLTSFPQLVAEPTDARSNSFVGTHEYLAPEIIKGDGHGSAVDWWTLGVFLYELLYGKTPFKGSSNEETVTNVMTKPLRLPENQIVSFYARDLIRGLLVKEPGNRLGFAKGAAEIKQHPFFEGLNWALIRCAVPPERPQFKKGNNLSFPECEGLDLVGFDLF
ncbi:hypothetical protein V2J09_020939 [Rumex salicifolius]